MTNFIQKNSNFCAEVCKEFIKENYIKDINPRNLKESFNLFKQSDGKWFKVTKSGLHDPITMIIINLDLMPKLSKLIQIIEDIDPEIKKEGGRIFISESSVYKIKKGTDYPLIIENIQNELVSYKFSKLCLEITEHGLERDRYRVEETYILTKAKNGEWSMSSSHTNHSGATKTLNLAIMPLLKAMAFKLNKLDAKFQLNGGRIFITPLRIYRINNKIEIDFKV